MYVILRSGTLLKVTAVEQCIGRGTRNGELPQGEFYMTKAKNAGSDPFATMKATAKNRTTEPAKIQALLVKHAHALSHSQLKKVQAVYNWAKNQDLTVSMFEAKYDGVV